MFRSTLWIVAIGIFWGTTAIGLAGAALVPASGPNGLPGNCTVQRAPIDFDSTRPFSQTAPGLRSAAPLRLMSVPDAITTHTLKFLLHPSLATGLTVDQLKYRFGCYCAELNAIFAKQTRRRFTFNPDHGIIFVENIASWNDYDSENKPEDAFDVLVRILPPENPTWGSYGGFASCLSSGTGVVYGLHWDAVHDPATLVDGSEELHQYWCQINNLTHELEHVFRAGLGEYYNIAMVADQSGVEPKQNISISATDPYWGVHQDYYADPLAMEIWMNPLAGSPNSLAALRDTIRFAGVSAAVINQPAHDYYADPLNTVPDLSAVKVVVRDADTGKPIPGATVRAWNNSTHMPEYTACELAVNPSMAPGEFVFHWDPYPALQIFDNNNNMKLLKVFAGGYRPEVRYFSIYDCQAANLLQGQSALELSFILQPDVQPGATATVQPAALSFGEQDLSLGPTQPLEVDVINTGTATLFFSGAGLRITGSHATDFTWAGEPNLSPLRPGQARAFLVSFKPGNVGVRQAELQITTHDADHGLIVVPLSGTGIERPVLGLTVGPLGFGDVDLDDGWTTRSVTIMNQGADTLHFMGAGVELGGADADQFSVDQHPALTALDPSASLSFVVAFDPSSVGVKMASLMVSTDRTTRQVILSGKGIDQAVTTVPQALVFGDQEVSFGPKPALDLMIHNAGTNTLHFTGEGICLIAGDAGDFIISGDSGEASLAPYQDRVLKIEFDPTTTGTRNATLRITTDDSRQPALDIPLGGVGVNRQLTVSPGPLDFGPWDIEGGATRPLTVNFENHGSGAVDIGSLIITGPQADRFEFVTVPVTGSLAAGENRSFALSFDPKTTGTARATLTIATTCGQKVIPLTGLGVNNTVSLATDQLAIDEAAGTVDLPVALSCPAGPGGVEVNLFNTIAPDLPIRWAEYDSDFAASPMGTLHFDPGTTQTMVSLKIVDDKVYEGDEAIHFILDVPLRAKLGVHDQLWVTIHDNEKPPTLQISPATLRFTEDNGQAVDVEKDDQPTTQGLTITNQGDAPLSITNLSFDGPNRADFGLAGAPDLPLTLAPGTRQALAVRFAPHETSRTMGLNARLLIDSNDPNRAQLAIPLCGDAVPVELSKFEVW